MEQILNEQAYRAHAALSSHDIMPAKTMGVAGAKWRKLNPKQSLSLPASHNRLGTAVHLLLPGQSQDRIKVYADFRSKRSQSEALTDVSLGYCPLNRGEYKKFLAVKEAVRNREGDFAELWDRITDTEVTKFGEWLGVPIKGRADAIGDGFVMDLKTHSNGLFGEKAYEYSYDIQADVYSKLFQRPDFYFCVVEFRGSDVQLWTAEVPEQERRDAGKFVDSVLQAWPNTEPVNPNGARRVLRCYSEYERGLRRQGAAA